MWPLDPEYYDALNFMKRMDGLFPFYREVIADATPADLEQWNKSGLGALLRQEYKLWDSHGEKAMDVSLGILNEIYRRLR